MDELLSYEKQKKQENKIEVVLKNILILDGNESNLIDHNTYTKFSRLIIELTKARYNIRYCSNENCPCHPETTIKKLIKDEKLKKFLEDNNIYIDIKELTENYIPIVSTLIYGE